MHPKSELFSAILTTWILSAVSCASLPFMHALPTLHAAGHSVPLIGALVLGAAVSVPLSFAVRRHFDLGSPVKNAWGSIAPREAALIGAFSWGVPLGLIFVVNQFLDTSDPFVAIPGLIIWPLAGLAFGLTMRWLAQRNARGAT
jgi:hypothetical protein